MRHIKKISIMLAANSLLALFFGTTVFHLLVLLGVIPFNIVWGGRLENADQMYIFESFSLTINLAVLWIVGMRVNYIPTIINNKVITAFLWLLVILFSLNTVGNLFSLNSLEAILFTPVTFVAAIFCCRLAVDHEAP
ncbi:MAG: hypothetical protein P8R02_02770 [Pseudomonadales bacterium]|nr:hypothetical protein [Pseudomonadales bacterium]